MFPIIAASMMLLVPQWQKSQETTPNDRDELDRRILAIQSRVGNKEPNRKLLLWALLLQNKHFARIKKEFEADRPPKEDFYLNLAYVQALIGLRERDEVLRQLRTMSLEREFSPLIARRFYYAGVDALERTGDRQLAESFILRAVDIDPTFEPSYQALAQMGTAPGSVVWYAKALSLVQPDTDFARRTRAALLKIMAKGEAQGGGK